MVHGTEDLLRVSYLMSRGFQSFERDTAGALVQKNAVYIDEFRAIAKVGDRVFVPEFFNESSTHVVLLPGSG